MKHKEIFVYTDWVELGKPVLMGVLFSDIIRGKEVFSFEYSDLWLDSKQRSILDPDLGFYSGPQYMRDDKSNFGLFLDSSPDRWGRDLMRRREPNLYESDFLLGVYDVHRMGALRFKLDPDGEFLDNNKDYAAPPWSTIRDLEYASMELEKNIEQDNPDLLKWINLLMAPGSSLGGARPKASVQDVNGELWIAKFPSKDDLIDTGAWEMVANEMAQKCGINTAVAAEKIINNIKKVVADWRVFATKYKIPKTEQDFMNQAFHPATDI